MEFNLKICLLVYFFKPLASQELEVSTLGTTLKANFIRKQGKGMVIVT